jgi:hypothetical protein
MKNIVCFLDTNEDNCPEIIIVEERVNEYVTTQYFIKENNKWKLFKDKGPM